MGNEMTGLSAGAIAEAQRLMAGPGCCDENALLRAALEELSAREDRLLTIKEVQARLNLAESTIYDGMAAGRLPKPVKIGARARWRASDIAAVIAGTWRP